MSDIKELLSYYKIRETLVQSQFERIDNEIKVNQEFAELMRTPVSDLPKSWAYLFNGEDWELFKSATENNTYYDFLKYLSLRYNDYILFSSENKENKLIGWMVYQKVQNGSIVGNIKFGSFTTDEKSNLELIQDIRREFFRLLNSNYTLEWVGCESNTKVFNMYKSIIEKYNGIMKHTEEDAYLFAVSKVIKLNEIPNLLSDK